MNLLKCVKSSFVAKLLKIVPSKNGPFLLRRTYADEVFDEKNTREPQLSGSFGRSAQICAAHALYDFKVLPFTSTHFRNFKNFLYEVNSFFET